MSPVVKTRSAVTGFTLIELLVVVFIIGILVAATLTIVPKVKRAVYGAQTSAQLSAIANAIQQYYNDYKSYPGPLPNNQLLAQIDYTQSPPPSYLPFVYDHNGTAQTLSALTSGPYGTPSNYNPTTSTLRPGYVSGAQNLVLGLLGGLELATDTNATTGALEVIGLNYNPQDIFSDGVTPAPKGASSLNFTSPRRSQPYIQVKAGDLSTPSTTYNDGGGGGFVDSSGDTTVANKRCSQDAMIPVFLDKYSDPLPILYYRTNVGGTAIVGYRNMTTLGSTTAYLTDPTVSGGPNLTAQYDLLQNLAYTNSRIGTIGASSTGTFHGLNGSSFTPSSNTNQLLISSSTPSTPPVDTIDYNSNGTYLPTNNGGNALAYFKDPTLNSTQYDGLTGNEHLGVARQKDGFILISAGPDRLYGTHDDVVFPGPLLPAQ